MIAQVDSFDATREAEIARLQAAICRDYGFVTALSLEHLIRLDPHHPVLVRCGCSRFVCAADNAPQMMKDVNESKNNHVRDVGLIAGDAWLKGI